MVEIFLESCAAEIGTANEIAINGWQPLSMATRPRSHIVGDLAVARIIEIFTHIGWACEKITQDYGEDLIVRIFDNNTATAKFFFVQSKATDDIERFAQKGGTYRYPFKSAYLAQWMLFRQPVIVTLYDASTCVVYWQPVQEYVNTLLQKNCKDLRSLVFSKKRLLNENGLTHIENIVTERYDLFDSGKAGAKILKEKLSQKYGLNIEFDQSGLIILPNGKFIATKSGNREIVVFGKMMRRIEDIARRVKYKKHKDVIEAAIDTTYKIMMNFNDGGKLLIRDASGAALEEFSNEAEFFEYIARERS